MNILQGLIEGKNKEIESKLSMLNTVESLDRDGKNKIETVIEAENVSEFSNNKLDLYTTYSIDDLNKFIPLEYFIEGILPKQGIGQLYGESMSGKSFLAIDLALSVAAGVDFFNHKVTKNPVIYLALEGQDGVIQRLHAAKEKYPSLDENFMFITEEFSMSNTQQVEKLINTTPKGALLIIDTQNCAQPDLDENSTKDMSLFIKKVKELQRKIEGFVLLIAHKGKDPSRGIRGSSVQIASMDLMIEVTRNKSNRFWKLSKAKDSSDNKVYNFELEVIDLVLHGKSITSCVIKELSALIKDPERQILSKDTLLAMDLFRKALEEHQKSYLTAEEWKNYYYINSKKSKDSARIAYKRANTKLKEENFFKILEENGREVFFSKDAELSEENGKIFLDDPFLEKDIIEYFQGVAI